MKGKAKLKTLNDLPPAPNLVNLKDGTMAPLHTSVPQSDRTSAPIQTHDVSDPFKMLGVHLAPVNKGSEYIAKMTERGFGWAENIATCPLSYRDTPG